MRALDSTERIFLRLERPGYPFDIAEILLLESSPEGPLPFERVRAVFNQRCYRSPALSRVVVPAPLGIGEERWTPAASLDIDQHVHQTTIPEPGDMPALLRTVIEVSREPLERGRPLWQAWYLTGMADGTAALVLRTHHATVDGLGIAQLHRLLFDTEPTPVDVDLQPPPPRGVGGSTQLRRALFEIPDRIATEVVTDYLAAHHELPTGPIRTTSPAHLPAEDDDASAGNHFTTIWIDLPVHLADPAQRLVAVSASATAAKQSLRQSRASWQALADLGDLLLPGVVAAAMALPGTRAFGVLPPTQNLTTSTVIGSHEPRYLGTRKITHVYARTILCPPINLFICSYTYAGIIDFSITTIQQLCPDPETLAAGLQTELDRLLTLARPDHPRRRAPR